jgi:hypothetical protein
VWLYFSRRTDLLDGRPKRVLHIAPEQCFEGRQRHTRVSDEQSCEQQDGKGWRIAYRATARSLRQRFGAGYLTADLLDPRAMERMDITDIRHPDESFDVI